MSWHPLSHSRLPGVAEAVCLAPQMLEFYGDREGAREVLTNYAYDEKFPSNPNAHVYLYGFLKREKAPREKLISVLKVRNVRRCGEGAGGPLGSVVSASLSSFREHCSATEQAGSVCWALGESRVAVGSKVTWTEVYVQ